MRIDIYLRLAVMMFLEFFIWGAWYVTMGTYLTKIGFSGLQVGAAYSCMAWAAIVSPFFIGLVADRFFNGERVLGALHLVGGCILWYVSTIQDSTLFWWMLLAYALCYMPTISLVNAIAFHQMTSPEKQFPLVRVLGTIGWIVAGIIVGFLYVNNGTIQFGAGEGTDVITAEATSVPMKLGAIVSFILGIYAFMLPHTPPKSRGEKVSISSLLGLETLQLMKDRSFAVFILCSFLVCIPLAFYYNFTNPFLNESGVENAAAKMTLGQFSEIVFMLVMPLFFVRLGVKKMLLIGMLAWTLRYVLFAFGNADSLVFMYYLGILLHGICYDFFFVTGQIYVDNRAPAQLRASAQGFIALVTYGAGMAVGSYISGAVVGMYAITGPDNAVVDHEWKMIWIFPAIMAGAVALLFLALFRDQKLHTQPGGEQP